MKDFLQFVFCDDFSNRGRGPWLFSTSHSIFHTLQNNWPVLFESVKVKKDKGRWRTDHMEETKEVWHLNARWVLDWILDQKKWWHLTKVCSLVNSVIPALTSWFWPSAMVMWHFYIGEGGQARNSLCYFCSDSVHLKLIQNKKFI